MIYVDKMGHMISDTSLEELHLFAKELGLKREWFQDKGWYSHYDLTTQRMRNKALLHGAILSDPRDIVRILQKKLIK